MAKQSKRALHDLDENGTDEKRKGVTDQKENDQDAVKSSTNFSVWRQKMQHEDLWRREDSETTSITSSFTSPQP